MQSNALHGLKHSPLLKQGLAWSLGRILLLEFHRQPTGTQRHELNATVAMSTCTNRVYHNGLVYLISGKFVFWFILNDSFSNMTNVPVCFCAINTEWHFYSCLFLDWVVWCLKYWWAGLSFCQNRFSVSLSCSLCDCYWNHLFLCAYIQRISKQSVNNAMEAQSLIFGQDTDIFVNGSVSVLGYHNFLGLKQQYIIVDKMRFFPPTSRAIVIWSNIWNLGVWSRHIHQDSRLL